MENVKLGLDAWRAAERRCDGLALDSPERLEAEEDARSAAKAFHAEVAQASARYAEVEYQVRNPWWLQLNRRTSRAGEPVAEASPLSVAAGGRSVTQVNAGAGHDLGDRRS